MQPGFNSFLWLSKLSLLITRTIPSPLRVKLQKTSSAVQLLHSLKEFHRISTTPSPRTIPKILCHPGLLLLAVILHTCHRVAQSRVTSPLSVNSQKVENVWEQIAASCPTRFPWHQLTLLLKKEEPRLSWRKASSCAHWAQRKAHWKLLKFLMGVFVSTLNLDRLDAYWWLFLKIHKLNPESTYNMSSKDVCGLIKNSTHTSTSKHTDN